MNNNVDKFFKEKLGEHSLPPSAQAWEKVEAHLTKKNRGIVWFRIAAVLALLSLFTFVMLKNGREEGVHQMATRQPAKAEKEKTPAAITKEEPAKEEPVLAQQAIKKEDHTVADQKEQPIAQHEPLIVKTNAEQPAALPEEKQMEVPVIATEATMAQAAPQKSIKLTFSLPALKEPESPQAMVAATAAPEEKKTTLQKAVEKANEIRTGDVLGSLRDAKNDLFAWEFKKDKPKNNNGSY